MTTKTIIREHMEEGFVISQATARILTGRDSAGRRLQEIMQHEGDKYNYFMAEPKSKKGAPYKVFFKRINRLIKVEKTLNSTFVLVARANTFFKVKSREFNSRKSALNAIKSCNL